MPIVLLEDNVSRVNPLVNAGVANASQNLVIPLIPDGNPSSKAGSLGLDSTGTVYVRGIDGSAIPLNSSSTVFDSLTVNGPTTLNGPVTINSSLTVTGNTTLSTLTVTGPSTLGGMKFDNGFIYGDDDIKTLAIVDNVGADSYLEVESLPQNVNLNVRSTSADASITINAKGAGNIYTNTDPGGLLWHNAYFFTGKQIKGGAGRVGPGDPPVSQNPGALKLTFANTFFDDRPTGYAPLVDSVNYTIKLGLLPSSTWIVTGSVTGQENVAHPGNTVLELVLYYNNNGTPVVMARQRMPWFSGDTTYTSTLSAIVSATNVGTQEVYCMLENNSPQTVQINTYRLQAVMLK